MTNESIRRGLDAHAVNVMTTALLIPPPHRYPTPEERDAVEHILACAAAFRWQRKVIETLLVERGQALTDQEEDDG